MRTRDGDAGQRGGMMILERQEQRNTMQNTSLQDRTPMNEMISGALDGKTLQLAGTGLPAGALQAG